MAKDLKKIVPEAKVIPDGKSKARKGFDDATENLVKKVTKK